MSLSRRHLISAAGLAFGGLAAAARAPSAWAQDRTAELDAAQVEGDAYRSEVFGYGPLKRDPLGRFDLPDGFSYTVVSEAGQTMSDGLVVPHKTDGMGCFALGGDRVALVRNHELKPPDLDIGAFGPGRKLASKVDPAKIYDRGDDGLPLTGGTTTLVYDLRARRLEHQHFSLMGTSTNCAGGRTPRNTWLSCEETLLSKGLEVQKDHGWVFEVPAGKGIVADPQPITAMGRFRHEAAATDPKTGVVYLTEDMGDGFGLFYRYLPADRDRLHAGGRLQALGVRAGGEFDPRNWGGETFWKPGDWQDVRWIDLDGVDNPYEDLRHRGHAKGAAWFARGEGIYFGEGELYFACTNGGPGALGQIMRYRPSPNEGQAGEADQPGRLQLFVQPTDRTMMDMCDNIAVSPWGHLYVCEDKIGGVNYLRAVTPDGRLYTVGRNALPGAGDTGANSELAGVCFSPDGTTLFVNVYFPGTTLAITGPWGRFKA